jgi:hypothetical protein
MYKIITKSVVGITETLAVWFNKDKQYIFLDNSGNIMQFDKQTKKYCGLNDFISNVINYERIN